MAGIISILLSRNLQEVFGESDPGRRAAAIRELFDEDATFYAPDGTYHGRDAIDRIAGKIRATHPDFVYTEAAPPDELLTSAGRLSWRSGRAGEAPVYAGTDFIIVRDGRIAALYLFFDPMPA